MIDVDAKNRRLALEDAHRDAKTCQAAIRVAALLEAQPARQEALRAAYAAAHSLAELLRRIRGVT